MVLGVVAPGSVGSVGHPPDVGGLPGVTVTSEQPGPLSQRMPKPWGALSSAFYSVDQVLQKLGVSSNQVSVQ